MSGIISLHIPSKVERFGIRTHGLVKCPVTELAGGAKVCYLRDFTLTTRDGKVLPVPYSAAEIEQSISPCITPRPHMYMHPLASMQTEDESGADWSGYAIFYEPGCVRGYLSNFLCAFTPDDNSQALLFTSNNSYVEPLMIGSKEQPQSKWITGLSYGMLHVSVDGRFRLFGNLGRFSDLEIRRLTGDFANCDTVSTSVFQLSGLYDSGIMATGVTVNQPEMICEPPETTPVDGTSVRNRMLVLWEPGGCVAFDNQNSYSLVQAVDSSLISRMESRSVIKRPIDAHAASENAAEYLYVSWVSSRFYGGNPDVVSTSESYTFSDSTCGDMFGSHYGNMLKDGSFSYSVTSTSDIERLEIFTLSGWGQSSNIVFGFDLLGSSSSSLSGDLSSIFATPNITRSATMTAKLTLDGVSLLSESKSNSPSYNAVSEWSLRDHRSLIALPQALSGADTWLDSFVTATELGGSNSAIKVTSIRLGVLKLGEGIQSFFVFMTRWVEDDTYSGELPQNAEQKLYLGRVFGFGTSRAGMEIPQSMWGDRLYAAYDPVDKVISDIYDHPVFYQ